MSHRNEALDGFSLQCAIQFAKALRRQGLASTYGWESRNPFEKLLMKRIAEALIPALVLVSIGAYFGCQTLYTTAGAPQSGPVDGALLYYLPIGKITLTGQAPPDANPHSANCDGNNRYANANASDRG